MKLKYAIRIVKFYCATLTMTFLKKKKVVELLQPFPIIIIIIINKITAAILEDQEWKRQE